MQFYEIEMLTLPKILFACTVELERYRGSFHKKPDFLEILMIESPQSDPNVPPQEPEHLQNAEDVPGKANPAFVPYGSMLYRNAGEKAFAVPPGMLMATTSDTWCDTSAPAGQHQRHTTVGVEMKYCSRLHENLSSTEETALLERMRKNPGIFLVPHREEMAENRSLIRNAIGEIGARNASPYPADPQRALAAYFSFAAKLTGIVLQRLDGEKIPPAASRYVRVAKAYIHTHYREKIRVEQISRELGISEGYLQGLFRAATGYSVLEYCNRYRVETAIQYLKGRNMTLKETAQQIGIDDPYYLSRLFKKVTGLSPKEYREQKR